VAGFIGEFFNPWAVPLVLCLFHVLQVSLRAFLPNNHIVGELLEFVFALEGRTMGLFHPSVIRKPLKVL
jgi:hypothetical protein